MSTKWMVSDVRKKFEDLQPLVKQMKAKRAAEFAELMEECEAAAKLANKLSGILDDLEVKKAELIEGMNEESGSALGAYLDELDQLLTDVNHPLYGLGRFEAMFANLEREGRYAEEENREAQPEEEEVAD